MAAIAVATSPVRAENRCGDGDADRVDDHDAADHVGEPTPPERVAREPALDQPPDDERAEHPADQVPGTRTDEDRQPASATGQQGQPGCHEREERQNGQRTAAGAEHSPREHDAQRLQRDGHRVARDVDHPRQPQGRDEGGEGGNQGEVAGRQAAPRRAAEGRRRGHDREGRARATLRHTRSRPRRDGAPRDRVQVPGRSGRTGCGAVSAACQPRVSRESAASQPQSPASQPVTMVTPYLLATLFHVST